MKKVKRRAASALLISAALIVGMVVFLIQLVDNGHSWAMFQANASVYSGGILDTGTLTDRNGTVLAQAGGGSYSYASDALTRTACLHVVGDYSGNIGTGALQAFADKLAGYSLVNGVYSADGRGQTVALSIDADLNKTAYSALAGRSGAVLVSNYKTGEILCMVSSVSYDPNTTIDATDSAYEGVYLNRTISSTYTPGSVFKLVTTIAAIETMPDLFSRSFSCAGSATLPDGSVVNCTGWHGQQTIEQALANSCNCAYAELSLELGADTLAEYTQALGLTESASIDGIPTAAGRFDKAEAGTGDLAWSGIGQYHDLVCPFAMLRLVSAVANGGELATPTLLSGGGGGTEALLSAGTAARLGEMMAYNVSYAYGTWRFPGLDICAKSGTAEVGDGSSHAWFVGYLDSEETPLAFTVVIEHGGGGLDQAGAVANTVLQAAVSGS